MKKLIAIVLLIAIIAVFAVQPLTVSALGDLPVITCESKSACLGKQVTVDVNITNNPGFAYLEISPSFPAELGTPNIENGELISNFTSDLQYIWVSDADVTADGKLFSITFDVPKTTAPGDYDVDLIFRGAWNYKEGDVSFTVDAGKISVKADHTWNDGVITKSPTCAAEGIKTFTCTECGATKTETIKKTTTHTWDSGKVTKAATCAATGVKTFTCTVCQATKTETIAKITTHTWDSGKVTKAATCAATGVKTYTCTVCKATKTETIKKTTTHTSDGGKVTKATLTKAGKKVFTCKVCNKVLKTETIAFPKTIKISATSYTYDGKVKKPTVSVKDSNNKTVASSNFTVTYSSGCKSVGKYSVKITFKGNYNGTKTFTYTINPKGTTVSKLTTPKTKQITVAIKKNATQTTGYQIQYSTSKTFASGNKIATVTSNKTTSKNLTGLAKGKTYYVRIRTYKTVGKTKYYSAWSTAKYIKTK